MNEITMIKEHAIRPVVQFEFRQGFVLYVRYNDFNEYSYQIQFSESKYDRIRFDNYDENWDVSSNPHHLHPRHAKEADKSEMVGNPEIDMPILINMILELL
jgi:hypothetical protein